MRREGDLVGASLNQDEVAAITLGTTLGLTKADTFFCDVGDGVFHRFIPRYHLLQVVQRATVMKATTVIYVFASETGML